MKPLKVFPTLELRLADEEATPRVRGVSQCCWRTMELQGIYEAPHDVGVFIFLPAVHFVTGEQ